ncbi:MAG: DNA polymerase III subunit gamma/tau [Archangium gephyra]|uniref:DNA polymerase III subunit gamma/tau n=1 Tax=Archangium gephyra TaxID=48 RepID=A0A2W5VH13_9BACT|nr:MAG: DNA polymerase III subunit gamma/tau [Archangium gephyra]
MSYTVLARKYRPQAFESMTGQEHVVRTIENAIKLDRVAHAYLFAGPRGVGKTTAARLLARALNCEKGPTSTPCGECKACREIRDGTSTDVAEIDGASNNGVENVREIRENAKYLPQGSRFKIYIIDEVHMLSQAAFNALLKTLEEPPGHVKFIFATTEAHKLPDTILSRCQRHNFRRISAAAMLKRLQEIAALEHVKVSGSALSMIVRQSEGGMRDALSLLDQVISACGLDPSDADVAEALGAIDRTVIHAIAVALVKRDAKTLLVHTEELWNRGVDLRRLAEDLAHHLRHVFVAKATGAAPEELAESDRDAVVALARESDAAQVARLFDVVHSSVWEIARAPQPKLALEMTLLKGLHLAPAAALPELIARVEKMSQGASGGRSTSAPFRA